MVRQAHSIPGKKSVFSPSMNSDSGSFPWSLTAKSLTPPIDFQPANVNFPVLRYTSLLMNSITTLDNLWMGRPRSIAAGLLESDGHRAVVDPGPGSTLETLHQNLQARGLGVGDFDAILLTHIHLDHAGGTATLVRKNPRPPVDGHQDCSATGRVSCSPIPVSRTTLRFTSCFPASGPFGGPLSRRNSAAPPRAIPPRWIRSFPPPIRNPLSISPPVKPNTTRSAPA